MKRDWEERTAKRVLSNDKLTLGFGSNSVEDIAALAKLLRRAGDRCTPRKARSTAMKKGPPQRDWAERTAKRVLSNDELTLGFGSNSVEDISALARLLRRAEKRGWQARQKYDEDVRMGKVRP